MMDKTGSTSQLVPKNSRRQFFQWAVKWFYANSVEDTSTTTDIPSVICLLQAAGFKLREFERRNESSIKSVDEIKTDNIRITMECGTSKMVAVLEMDGIKCECPDLNKATDGSFWSISGTGPMASMDNVNKIEETGSNLLPEISKETTSIVRDVVHRLLKIINNKCGLDGDSENLDLKSPARGVNRTITKSTEVREGLVRSYTDLYDQSYKPRTSANFSSNLTKRASVKSEKHTIASGMPILKRQGTFELDDNESMEEPRPSPPKLASSPVLQQLCTSLGQISLQSEEDTLGLADYIVKAHQILEKAMNHIIRKLPANTSQASIRDDANFVKPTPPPLMSSSFCSSSPRRTGSNNMINRSVSSASSSSRLGSTSSLTSARPAPTNRAIPGTQKSVVQRNGNMTKLPPMRDRSSSLSAAQRLQQSSASTIAGQLRRKSSTAVSTLGLASNSRTPATGSKLPASKLAQTKSNTNPNNERTLLTAKRRSPDAKNQTSSPSGQLPRSNVSMIKAPTTTSRMSSSFVANTSSKFGFNSAKK